MHVVKWHLKRIIRNILPDAAVQKILDPVTAIQHLWSIGLYTGPSPYRLSSFPHIRNPILTRDQVSDVRALFVADPFMFYQGDAWHMFFEVYNYDAGKGEIGYATSRDGLSWTYEQIVLREPFHLSYPYVFEAGGRCYMIPETHQAGSVMLYEAEEFPYVWACTDVLLRGHRFSDSSLFRYADLWWLFSETSADLRHDTLRLYFSSALRGPWQEHPDSPIIHGNPHISRPAGRVIMWEDRPVRFAQDCFPIYGTRVQAFQITELSTSRYREVALSKNSILGPGYRDWNVGGMHHIDAHELSSWKWLAVVDGWQPVWQLVPEQWRTLHDEPA